MSSPPLPPPPRLPPHRGAWHALSRRQIASSRQQGAARPHQAPPAPPLAPAMRQQRSPPGEPFRDHLPLPEAAGRAAPPPDGLSSEKPGLPLLSPGDPPRQASVAEATLQPGSAPSSPRVPRADGAHNVHPYHPALPPML